MRHSTFPLSLLAATISLCVSFPSLLPAGASSNSSNPELLTFSDTVNNKTTSQQHNKTAKQHSFWLNGSTVIQQLAAAAAASAAEEDPPIVMNSVHSAANNSPKLRPQSPVGPQRLPPSGLSSFSGQRPRPSITDERQEARSGASFMSQQQPSQEFEPAAGAQVSSRGPTRWSPQSRPSQDSMSSGGHYGISSAPYAVQQPLHQHHWSDTSDTFSAISNPGTGNQLMPIQPQQQQNTLIRDTSQLHQSSEAEQQQQDELQSQQQHQVATSAHSLWVQSVRDNHHGPLRSRFNLTGPFGSSYNISHTSSRNEPQLVAGESLFTDAHMKAKADPNAVVSWAAAAEQQARSATQTTTTESSNWARRNSKFTRQSTETTTPTPIGTGNINSESNQSFETDSSSIESVVRVADDSTSSNKSVFIVNNNHSALERRRTGGRPKEVARQLPEFSEPEAQAGSRSAPPKQPNRGWTRHLPGLLQRTFSSVLRRITGAQSSPSLQAQPVASASQHQVQQPVMFSGGNSFPGRGQPNGSPSAMSFLASALSAAATAAMKPDSHSLVDSIPLDHQTLGGKLQQQLSIAANSLHETRQPLRQHANKKIIDSLIDLPVSERRQTRFERRVDSLSSKNATHSNRQAKTQSDQWTSSTDESDEAELLTDDQDEDQDTAESQEEPLLMSARSADSFTTHVDEQDEAEEDTLEMADSNYQSVVSEQPVESADEEPEEAQFYFYSPAGSLRTLDGSSATYGPLRLLADEIPEERKLPHLRRRRPESVPSRRRRPSSSGSRPLLSVPPLNLHSLRLRPIAPTSTTSSTAAPAIATLPPLTSKLPSLTHAIKQTTTQNSAAQPMLSPMSSSINVLDLDPSMTQLAHNKLIVAKYKPSNKLKHHSSIPRIGTMSSQRLSLRSSTTTTSTTLRPSTVGSSSGLMGKSGASSGGNQLTSKLAASLKSSNHSSGSIDEKGKHHTSGTFQFGNQVITNNHISDIISRWTRLGGAKLPNTKQPSDTLHKTYESSGGNSLELSGRLSPTLGLSGRPSSFSLSSSRDRDSSPTPEAVRVPEQWNSTAGMPNLNYSLLSMNNRERINPLLLPIQNDHQQLKTTTNTTFSRRQSSNNQQKARLTSTTLRSNIQRSTQSPNPTTTLRPNPTTPASDSSITASGNVALRTGNRKPGNELEESIGQIVRSQHKQVNSSTRRPMPSKPYRPHNSGATLSESERLRNQLNSLTGPLDGRAQPPASEMEGGSISGHVTLVASLQEEAAASSSLPQTEDAAREANKYETLGSESGTSFDDTLGMGVPGEQHSIVIIKDNHHPSLSSRLNRPTTSSTSPPSSLAAHLSSKYLDELVNGTRIRPSSAERAKLSSSNSASGLLNPENWLGQWPRSSHSPSPSTHSIVINTNHAPSMVNSTEWTRRSGIQAKQQQQAQQISNSAHGAPFPESEGISGKLDYRAQELLQDVFDRDPSYSASFFATAPEHQAERFLSSANLRRQSDQHPKAENSRRISNHDELLQYHNHKQASTPAYELAATHYAINSDVPQEEQLMNDIRDASNTPFEFNSLITQPVDGASTSVDYSGRSNLPTSTAEPAISGEQQTSDQEQTATSGMELNKRASMRRNQAMIQSILMAIEAKKNAQAAQGSTNSTEQQQDEQVGYTTSIQDNNYQSSSTASDTQFSNQIEFTTAESTSMYSPTRMAETPVSSTTSRYPTLSVENVSASRQKINKPTTPSTSDYSSGTSTMASNSPSSPSPTSKLTESPSKDSNLRQTIKNRIHLVGDTDLTIGVTSTMAPQVANSNDQDEQNGTSSSNRHPVIVSSDYTSSSSEPNTEPQLDAESILSDQLELAAQQQQKQQQQQQDEQNVGNGNYQPNEPEIPTKKRRPVIIRRRSRPTARRPVQQQPQYLVVSEPLGVSASIASIKRRKPVKKPVLTKRPNAQLDNQPISLTELIEHEAALAAQTANSRPYEANNETAIDQASISNNQQQQPNEENDENQLEFVDYLHQVSPPKRRHRPTILVQRPLASPAIPTIIRKRPSYVRYPPNSIRIPAQVPADYHVGKNNTRIRPHASIILPMESIMKLRPAQDIRTRPLTIIDPSATSSSDLPSSSESLSGSGSGSSGPPLGLTIIPETTILHNNMIVSYKPGRPLPPGSSSRLPASFILHETNSSATTPMPGSTPFEHLSISSNTSRPSISAQLGAGNGGDTHLVSIEVSHQQRPHRNTTSSFESLSSPSPSSLTTSYPHRPIIVINGLATGQQHFGTDHNHNHNNSTSDSSSSSHPHKSTTTKPPGGNSVVEAGSLSVLAQASHGNHSRPWYPTVGSSSTAINSNTRHNGTSNSTSSGSLSELVDLSSSGSSNSVSLDSGSDSSSSYQPSGSYQNHHQQQSQSQHIGMPYLGSGGSLSSAFRPSLQQQQQQQRPYRWRVRKRPNGSHGNVASESSSSSYIYRPAAPGLSPLQQLFTMNGLTVFYDNMRIFMARIRTLLISLMVMFLPPLALAASVANAMSS